MKTIRVRDVPDDVHAVLEALSRAALREWSVPGVLIREVLDEVRAGR